MVRDQIDTGVLKGMSARTPTVVVSHSLGTVVAYNLLKGNGANMSWNVPLFVTLGSPLGVTAIRTKLSPVEHPSCVGHWHNAADKRDVVALYPLDRKHFDIDPEIENRRNLRNRTSNRHGISGYLDDKGVALLIHDALIAAGG